MAATDPNPNVDPTITGQEAWFNKDVRVYEDLYVYGNLYYNFDGTDSLDLDNLTVSGIATFNNVDITGSLDLQDLTLRNLFSTGIATFTNAILPEIDNLQVGILTVTEFFRIDNGTTEFVTIPATGSRAGNVGINSTLPDQKLDIGGSIHIDEQIFDSDNASGNIGNYLSKDAGGIRWVSVPPNANADGVFARNEGINIGVGSFTTLNLIGTRSGGDIVFGTDAGGGVLDIDIRSRWIENSSGIHTTANVGINIANPTKPLDVDGSARIRSDLDVDGILYANSQLDVDGAAILRNTLNVQQAVDFDQDLNVDGDTTLDGLTVDERSTFNDSVFIGKDVIIDANTHIRGNSKISDNCIIGPNTFIENSEIGVHCEILNSTVSDSRIMDNIKIGPYSHIRPNCQISSHSKIGNFVEIKNSQIREEVKINHLSYIGDSTIGASTNVGAGTITANFDGRKKHQTKIGKNSSIGANTVLIAPVNLGESVTTGAGSVITKDIQDNALAITRTKQVNIDNWERK